MKRNAGEKGITLSNAVKPDTCVIADLQMMEVIIRNLLSNAVKFTENGGRVVISSITTPQGEERITVSDTGIGISEENIGKIFRLETHFSTVGTRNERGTGIGLSICRKLVEKNHGRIWVESECGKGSHFHFTLPGVC